MKKRWIFLALPIALGLIVDNALPYMLIDHGNRPVSVRSQLWNIANLETIDFTSQDGTNSTGWWVPRSGSTKTIILLHSLGGNREDLLIFAEPSEQLFGAAQEPKLFYQIPGASHDTMLRSRELQQAVIRFIQ
jgi:hypothetical protein